MEPKLIHRKETLIITAIEIIDNLGFQGFTTKEIAKREGISESTIFKHFKSKNELILAILDIFSQYDESIIQSVKCISLTPCEAILYFIDFYVTYYENYPEITAIFHAYDSLASQPDLRNRLEIIFTKRAKLITYLLNQAKELGILPSSINTGILTDIIIGTERGINLKWRMSNYNFSLKEQTLNTVKLVIDAFTVNF